VKVLGLPSSGAKSRVETQIKICIQLTNSTGELATNWSHLMLPEHMVARDKLKRRNPNKCGTAGGDIQQQTNGNGSPSLDSDILKLEAAVVCDGHADNEIIMCSSCVHREVTKSNHLGSQQRTNQLLPFIAQANEKKT
jgi:hypothetical protein